MRSKYLPVVLVFSMFLINIGALKAQDPFVTVWKTDNPGTSGTDEITIPTTGGGYNYDVLWASAADPATVLGSLTGQTGDVTITFPAAGEYEVSITGDFPAIYFNNTGDKEKILEVKQWGDIAWQTMLAAFYGASNLQVTATDAPDLSAVTTMAQMFRGASSLSSDLNHWDVSNVTNMGILFMGASVFNGNIHDWDVSNVWNMGGMFQSAVAFNGDLSGWDVSSVTNMNGMFAGATAFLGTGVQGWNVSQVTDMGSMFAGAAGFNAAIGAWDVSSVTNMASMFIEARIFNSDISGWDVSNVTRMSYMFMEANAFNQNLARWDVSAVTTMERMFHTATAFNSDISGWDVSNVTSMLGMFQFAGAFNADINGWDVSNVTTMASMFQYAAVFNRDVSSWDVSHVTDMQLLFYAATAFDQDLGGWDISSVTDMTNMLSLSGLSLANYDATLTGWSTQAVQPGLTLGAQDLEYCAAAERQSLIDNHGWAFTGDSPSPVCPIPGAFVTTWKTDNAGSSASNEITIPTTGSGYNYDVQWASVADPATVLGSLTSQTGDVTITFSAAGTYVVSITGDFPRIFFNDGGDKEKILTVEQWGNIAWTSMAYAFFGATNLRVTATDAPDLSAATEMTGMFMKASSLNSDLSHWDVSNVSSMASTFQEAAAFDGGLGGWEVSGVTDMSGMFADAYAFTGRGLGNWDVSQVTDMESMFFYVTAFNGDVSGWDVSQVGNMDRMFAGTPVFNADISGWDVSNVTSMVSTFISTRMFNADISGWDVSQVTNMRSMFFDATAFDRDLGGWDIASVTTMEDMLSQSGLSSANYDATITGWAGQAVQPGVPLGATGRSYCSSAGDRYALIHDHGWAITGDTYSGACTPPDAFVTTWDPGVIGPFLITIPTVGTGYNYDIHWASLDDPLAFGVVAGQTGDVTLTVPMAGTYRVSIVGDFPRIYFNNTGDRDKIRTVEQWGAIAWTSMENAFYGAEDIQINAADAPDLSGVTSMARMFSGALSLNSDFNHWDVSTVTDMNGMFDQALAFNGDVSGWDVSAVTDMANMFRNANLFDHDLSGWDITAVTDMAGMLDNTGLSRAHYDAALTAWAAQAVQTSVALGAAGLEYCADMERQSLIDDHSWAISGDVLSSSCLSPITGITFIDGSFVYDGTAQSLAISGTLPAGTSVSYVDNSRTDAGTQTVTANISGGGVYEDLTLTAMLTVTRATITGITFVDGTFVYDGTAQSLAIGGTLPSGTSVSYADNSRTDAGSQTATATVNGGTNYDNLVLTATLTVTPATITGVTFADGSFVYDGTAQSLAIGGTLPAGTSVSYADNSRADAGSQTATATISGGTNYDNLVLTAILTVTPAMITGITFADGSFVYDGTARSLAVGGTLPAGTSVSYADNTRTDAGSQTATATILGGTNYDDLVLTATLTVTPATITGVTFADGSFVYDGTAQSLAIGGTLPSGTSVSYADNSRTDAGSQTATATVNGGTNYDNLVLTATLTVTPATITGITFADGSFVYDGTAQSLAIGGTLPAGTSVSYADNNRTDAGSQTTTATVNGGTNYDNLVLTATLTVTPAMITGITFADGSFVYDGTAQSLAIGGTLPAGTSVSYTNNSRTDAGSQTATATIRGGTNYDDLVLTATLTVTRATITGITFADGSFVYDGTAQSLAIGGRLPAGASVSYARNHRVEVGSQTVTATILGGTNYEDRELTATLTILPSVRTLAFDPLPTLTYGDADHKLEAESSSGEAVLFSSSNGEVAVVVDGALHIVGAGTTVITATLPENPLYENTPSQSHPFTVNKAPQAITFHDVPTQVNRDAGIVPLDVSASSSLPVSLHIDDEEVAVLNGADLDILRLGTVQITATQAGDANYAAAESVITTIRVVDPTSDMPIRVHQALSPNGDGINEYLIVEAIKDYPKNRVSVFNRNGTVVYEASGYNNGTVAFRGVGTGQLKVPAGTYFYIAEIQTEGEWKYEKGWFVLRY